MPRYNPPNHDTCFQIQERQAVPLSRTARKGVSLAEYSLIFGILISLAIPSVGLLGGSVSQNMDQIVAAFQQGPLAAIFGGGPIANNPGGGNAGAGGGSNNNGNGGANNGGGSTATGGGAGGGNGNPMPTPAPMPKIGTPNTVQAVFNPQTGQIEYMVFDGNGAGVTSTSVEGKDLVDSMKKLVAEKGIGEASSILNGNIVSVADDLLASGEIDVTQHASLIALANQGMTMGSIESALENHIAQLGPNPTASQMANTTVDWNGQQWSLHQLSTQVGCNGDCMQGSGQLSSNIDAHPQTAQFIDLFNQAAQSGALNNPAVDFLVTELSTQIVKLSDAVESTFAYTFNPQWQNGGPPASWGWDPIPTNSQEIAASLNRDISEITYTNSGTICSTGGGTTSGGSCQ